jgi:hypothetical protein
VKKGSEGQKKPGLEPGKRMIIAARIGAALAATLILLAPALWNRFPLLQYDTGGYLARWFEGYLVPSRSVLYGYFLTAGWPLDFWPVVVLQALAAVWVIALTLRAYGLNGRPLVLVAVVALLAVFTALPWIASILLTDVFAGVAVLALALLALRADTLNAWERRGLLVLAAFSAATHSATFLVLLSLAVVALVASLVRRDMVPRAGVARAFAAVALGAVMLLAANYTLARRVAWTPGGYGIVFARMLQDGIVHRYLSDRCPDQRLQLCKYQHVLPLDADAFLWGESVFDSLGRFDGLGEEMRKIVLESLLAYPWMQLKAALDAALGQFVKVATGEGVLVSIYHTYGMIEMYTPSALPAMRAARQQHDELDFTDINRLHVPVAYLSMLLLPLISFFGLRSADATDLGLLAATVTLAILANAFICGPLSNAHDRYGSRLIWVAALVVVVAVARLALRARAAVEPVAYGRTGGILQ